MDIQSIISQLKEKFGDKFDISSVTQFLKGIDTSKLSLNEIVDKIKTAGLLPHIDASSIQDTVKDKLSGLFGK